ncbi:MAG: hypothetical protein WBX30_25195, partial [Stellaceae bacterium]
NIIRRRLGYQYSSLSAYLKHRVKNAMQYIGSFADAVATEATRRGVDGIVCGHIHHAEIREMNGVLYCNDGDWVESCTALVEHFDGRLELVHWIEDWMHDPLRRRVDDEPEIEVKAQLPEFATRIYEDCACLRRVEATGQRRRAYARGLARRAEGSRA